MREEKFIDLFSRLPANKLLKTAVGERRVIKASALNPAPGEVSKSGPASAHLPEIRVKKRGNKVEWILFRCTCGKETRIALEYQTPEKESLPRAAKTFPQPPKKYISRSDRWKPKE